MRLRPMTRADLPAVLKIERATFSAAWVADAFVGEMEGPVSHAWVMETDDRTIVGYALFRVILDEAHLMNLALATELRGNGWGRWLMQRIVDKCRTLGAEFMFLEVRPSNLPARGLYEAFGFELLGIRKRYYTDNGEDALVLKLDFPLLGEA